VILEGDNEYSEDLEKDLINEVADKASKISRPNRVYAVGDLPKTNSGKIMRRILQNIAEGEDDLGDTSTLRPEHRGDHSEQVKQQMS
jgi:acetyl-CoA synthetase